MDREQLVKSAAENQPAWVAVVLDMPTKPRDFEQSNSNAWRSRKPSSRFGSSQSHKDAYVFGR